MNKISDKDILEASRIGYEFEFISKEDPVKIAHELTKLFGIKVVVPMNVDKFNKKSLFYHTCVDVNGHQFKIEADFSGGIDCKELITGPLPYKEATEVLIKTLNWIKQNAMTTDRTAIQINVSFDTTRIKTVPISKMNKLKFCLGFNEDFIWKRFPNRKNSIYCKSIKHILLKNIFNVNPTSATQFSVAPSKYFSVNLSKAVNEYIEFRFMGGENYHMKKKEILEIQDYSILNLYRLVQQQELNQQDENRLQEIVKEYDKFLQPYKNPDVLGKYLPDVQFSIDMNNNPVVIKAMWEHVKDGLMSRIIDSGTTKMKINYDSAAGEWQIREAKLEMAEMSNTTFLKCSGYGMISKSKFYDCDMSMVHCTNCEIHDGSIFKDAKIEETSVDKGCTLTNCYVNNKKKIADCDVIGGVWRNGKKGEHTNITKDCSIVSSEEAAIPTPAKNYGVYKEPDEHQYTNLNLSSLIIK